MKINKIAFSDISVKLPVSIDLDLRVDFYSTERNRLIEQINFLKQVVKKLCIANGNTIVVKRLEPVQYTDVTAYLRCFQPCRQRLEPAQYTDVTDVTAERLEIGGIGFNVDTDFVKIADKSIFL